MDSHGHVGNYRSIQKVSVALLEAVPNLANWRMANFVVSKHPCDCMGRLATGTEYARPTADSAFFGAYCRQEGKD